MRDIIWTLIIIWLIYKVVAVVKGNSSQRNSNTTNNNEPNSTTGGNETVNKSSIKKHLNNEGEYVDYEEIK